MIFNIFKSGSKGTVFGFPCLLALTEEQVKSRPGSDLKEIGRQDNWVVVRSHDRIVFSPGEQFGLAGKSGDLVKVAEIDIDLEKKP